MEDKEIEQVVEFEELEANELALISGGMAHSVGHVMMQ